MHPKQRRGPKRLRVALLMRVFSSSSPPSYYFFLFFFFNFINAKFSVTLDHIRCAPLGHADDEFRPNLWQRPRSLPRKTHLLSLLFVRPRSGPSRRSRPMITGMTITQRTTPLTICLCLSYDRESSIKFW